MLYEVVKSYEIQSSSFEYEPKNTDRCLSGNIVLIKCCDYCVKLFILIIVFYYLSLCILMCESVILEYTECI